MAAFPERQALAPRCAVSNDKGTLHRLPTIRKKHRTVTGRAREYHSLCPAFESLNSTAVTLPDAPVGTPPHGLRHRSPCNGSCLTIDAQDHGGVLGQPTENQNMRMASTTKSDETIGGHAHFLVLSLLAILRKITKNNEQQTTVPLSLLTTHLCARACLSGKSAGGGGRR